MEMSRPFYAPAVLSRENETTVFMDRKVSEPQAFKALLATKRAPGHAGNQTTRQLSITL
jgi:hypothetical protein